MEASDLVIDSDIIIDFLRRQSNTFLEAVSHYHSHLMAITVYELEAVVVKSECQIQQFEEILQWVRVLPLDVTAARQAAAVQRTLQQQGQVIGLPDTLIAGVCLAQQMPLLTRNSRHYQRVPGLQVITPADLTNMS